MTGTPFIIGPEEREALERLRDVANKSPVNMAGLLDRLKLPKLKAQHMRQMTEQTVYLPFGFAATFSIETNHPGGRTARHLSMSSPAEDRVPNPEAVCLVADILGFSGMSDIATAEMNLKQCDAVWLEDLQGHGKAVNVVQLVRSEEGRA